MKKLFLSSIEPARKHFTMWNTSKHISTNVPTVSTAHVGAATSYLKILYKCSDPLRSFEDLRQDMI